MRSPRTRKTSVVCRLLFFAVLTVPISAAAQTGWFNPSWNFRTPVTVSNPGASPLTNFQVHVLLGNTFPFGHAKSDGSDLRVTGSDGTTLIPFYIESWNSGSSASLWVQVPSVPSSGTTIYLYYGNSSAASGSSGEATFDFFDDFSYASVPSSVISKSVSWLMAAQDATSSGGVSYFYDIGSGTWNPNGYPEVTGYIIPTMYDVAAATTDPTLAANLRSRTARMANWELSLQGGDGSFGGIVFDTGQIVDGLVRAYQETGNTQYLNAAVRAGNWLLSVQASNGSWPNDYGGFAHAYHARVARDLLKLWQVTGSSSYQDAAIRNLNWVLTQQQSNGWFKNEGIGSTSENSTPLTHTIGYTMEGLIDAGVILNNSTYINAAALTANALIGQQRSDGALTGGTYLSNWTPATSDQCLTGDAQTALSWLKLYQYTVNQGHPNVNYLNAAVKMNRYLVGSASSSANPGINGGLAGSEPVGGFYQAKHILSWATKFFVDSINLETQSFSSGTLQFPDLDPNKWSFPAAQNQFHNAGGLLYYYSSTAGFGIEAVANKNGSKVVFNDGVVEYFLQSNGGFDEMGLEYRGQNPETANSYVFYPSIFNGQNDWLLYGLMSNNQNFLGSGGAFAPGTWYSVQARISGTSHFFSINGTPVFSTGDGTFSSGSLGLMAWGNTISWVSGFRQRKYAAVEPSATLGSEQSSAPSITSLVLNPASVVGGNPSTGTVTLNTTLGGTVALTNSNPSVVTVPASIPVPAGSSSASFTVNTNGVGTSTAVIITATYNGTGQTATLTVTPLLAAVALNPATVPGGSNSQGNVTLAAPAPGSGITVGLASSNTSLATVPASVAVPGGSTSASFTVGTSNAVTTPTSVTITATYGGRSQSATLTVGPPLSAVSFNPTSVVGGTNAQGTVQLAGPAPSGGAQISLSSGTPSLVTVPSLVTIPAGSASATFAATTSAVSTTTTVTVTTTYGSGTQTATLTLTPTGWFNPGWSFRVPISISNPGSVALTNFQVHVVLTSSFAFANAQSNGNDVRFTSGNGASLLPFWIETWSPSQGTASLWVNVASIAPTGATIYMYYGNAAATAVSNGNATFNFFDDFSFTSGGNPALDPSKWSFPGGSAGFSNIGGMLQYNGPSAGFGPRAIAMQGGSNVVFTNGIVEYNLQSNGGFDEMALLYRGQNPETANSYVFYPSVFNSQNTWLLYGRVSNASVGLGSGGSFNPGVWYAVKAAIGGSSHACSINGAQVVAVNDSTFSSGSVGLLAWGNTVSWVTNFRVRQYAATEPTAAVGSQQSGP